MSLYTCPFCGPRPIEEFAFHKTLPNVAGDAMTQTYLRQDDPRRSVEHWQHRQGCRAWLTVRRDPSSGEVLEMRLLGRASS